MGVETAVSLLQAGAARDPSRVIFRFLGADSADVSVMTYGDLDRRARAVARRLRDYGSVGQRAMVVVPPGLDFIAAVFGCLYAGWIAVPVAPPGRAERRQRLAAVLDSAEPSVVLTTETVAARLHDTYPSAWLALDTLGAGEIDGEDAVSPAADDIALLQYTSGSTGSPKGVMLSHANIVYVTRRIAERFGLDATTRGLLWLPPFHDMGLIGGIFEAVVTGMRLSLMAPTTFLRRPARWLEAIVDERAHVSGGPNFAYELCCERISEADVERLDLSEWRLAFNGAEPVRAATLERFAARFGRCGFRRQAFYPCYGLAEATLMVSGGQRDTPPNVRALMGRVLVSCGTAIDGEQLMIVDAASHTACADGQTGEIWVRGPGVAGGYWRAPAATAETFGARLGGPAPDPGGTFLRTGDLGCMLDGELYVTGRSKAVLVVAGRVLHAEDVEATVESSHARGWPGGVAAVVTDDGQRERLTVIQEVGGPRSTSLARGAAIVHAIRVAVADAHQLPLAGVVLVRPGTLPRTSSGKVQRHACREAYTGGRLAPAYEWTSVMGDV